MNGSRRTGNILEKKNTFLTALTGITKRRFNFLLTMLHIHNA